MSGAKDALHGIMKLIEDGDLVRNIENDHDATLYVKQGMRIVNALKKAQIVLDAQHCQCRSGSPDTCPKCTDMKTGEKYADETLD